LIATLRPSYFKTSPFPEFIPSLRILKFKRNNTKVNQVLPTDASVRFGQQTFDRDILVLKLHVPA
jgi:hypothetical protein